MKRDLENKCRSIMNLLLYPKTVSGKRLTDSASPYSKVADLSCPHCSMRLQATHLGDLRALIGLIFQKLLLPPKIKF